MPSSALSVSAVCRATSITPWRTNAACPSGTSIGPSVEASLADRVRALYTFLYSRLLEASTERSIPKLDEVIGLLEYERETWALFIERMHAERRGATPPGASQATGATGDDRPARSLSMSA